MKRARTAAVLLACIFAWTAPLAAEEPPLAVGSEGVPVPKKVKDFKPKYPPEAVAQGIRGIVILDLVIDATGRVESVSVVRSVPGLDDAAVAAAHQWQYEPVKVAGRPVRVRMTVPITFSLALPSLAREAGVPELRQGVTPAFPQGTQGGGKAAVAVMLEPDGRIAARGAIEGSREPWTGALLAALETWRFSPAPDDAVVSFRIEAEFVAGKGSAPNAVLLKATGLKVADAPLAQAAPSAPTSAAAPVATTPASPAPAEALPAGPEKPQEPPPNGGPTPAGGPLPPAPPSAGSAGPRPDAVLPPAKPGTTGPTPAQTPPADRPPAAPAPVTPAPTHAAGTPAASPIAPPLEVITAPLPPPPPENGISAVRDVALEPGVPELARGRRPVPPPFARMAGATGTLEVTFSVSAAGATTIQKVTGPDLLKKAAEQAVASWVFRRTRADRAYLVAIFTYGEDKATASVRPQPGPVNPSLATPAAPGPTSAPASDIGPGVTAVPAPAAPVPATAPETSKQQPSPRP
jgi:TonB family protein